MSKSLSIDNDIEYLTCTSNYMTYSQKNLRTSIDETMTLSDEDLRTITIPIPIPNKSPQCSLSQENFDNLYFFKLQIICNDNDSSYFYYSDTKKHANLIKSFNKIKYDDIVSYEISIDCFDNNYYLSDEIEHNSSYYVGKNENLFIEFSQDDLGYAICNCYFINKDLDNMCISLPN